MRKDFNHIAIIIVSVIGAVFLVLGFALGAYFGG